jgi:hypothetical protein
MKSLLAFLAIGVGLATGTVWAGQSASAASSTQGNLELFSKAVQAMALVVAGDGSGDAPCVSVGVIAGSDGVLLAGYHALKGGLEVQVRLQSGEVYDQVSLLGFDERRDVAALHIPAQGLTSLARAAVTESAPGDKIHLLTTDGATGWTSYEGVLGPVQMADQVSGAGVGYRVIQFTAQLPAGALGGALLNSRGQLLGILAGPPNSAGHQFAIPLESIAGLPMERRVTALGSGKNLTLSAVSPRSEPADDKRSTSVTSFANAQSLRVTSNTTFFSPFMLEKELLGNSEFRVLGLGIVNGFRGGDLLVNVDRPLFTYDFTYTVTNAQTGVVLATGKITAIDGPHAAQGIAKVIVRELEKARGLRAAEPNLKELAKML